MTVRDSKWSLPLANLLKARDFKRDMHAIPRSVFIFRRERDRAIVELRFHLVRIRQAGVWREYPSAEVAAEAIRDL